MSVKAKPLNGGQLALSEIMGKSKSPKATMLFSFTLGQLQNVQIFQGFDTLQGYMESQK